MKKQKGFSLIELLIVVAIILIIAAIAIPIATTPQVATSRSSSCSSADRWSARRSRRTARRPARVAGWLTGGSDEPTGSDVVPSSGSSPLLILGCLSPQPPCAKRTPRQKIRHRARSIRPKTDRFDLDLAENASELRPSPRSVMIAL